jgi:hypothetical protein
MLTYHSEFQLFYRNEFMNRKERVSSRIKGYHYERAKSELIFLHKLPSSHAKFLRNIMRLIRIHFSPPRYSLLLSGTL